MNNETRSELIVLVSGERAGESRLSSRLREETTARVRSISVDELETVLEANCPVGVVFEIDDPDVLRDRVDLVRSMAIDLPIVVVPERGSEALATAALRGGATDYVSAGSDEAVARILEPIRTTGRSARDPDGDFRRILANELPDEAFVIGEDGTCLEARFRARSEGLYSVSADSLVGMNLTEFVPDETAASLQDCVDRTLRTGNVQSIEYDLETTDGCRRFDARVVPVEEWIEGRRAVIWLARDITERANRERELRSRQAQLETLNRINAVVRQVIETLVDAPGRDAIERGVCDQLVESELYCGSWIAEWTGNDELAYRTGSGGATEYLSCARETTSSSDCPFRRAARTGEIQTINRILEREPFPHPLQGAAREDGIRAAIAVPITHNETTYGVLSVLSGRADAFSDSEQTSFDLLGETIGFTIMAIKNRQLLFADSVVELEFRINGGETFSFDISREYGCSCTLEWAGTTTGGRTYQFVTIDGIDGETALEAANEHESVEECQLVQDGTEGCTLELRLRDSGVRTLTNHGVTIRDVVVESDVGTCLIEVPQSANVREISNALGRVYDQTELVARRDVDRPVRTAAERHDRILDELTERQLTTLRLAYYGGFFDWPRERTGEEIASSMNISPPTMHQHLRKGLKTILGEFFEATATSE
ncbi:PAS domain S-box protein [Natrarchaeobius halalkaliphilus]|uniref:PAS domain S-box protein n=1 Tax=Natrarchaeobius halalkaliphilus TaxID=1679091 RepID=A0A3N6P1F6_9EURY|nr:bacterio-opsin activator domain-containing protein [Natrarchaeobius halalkaliphilus]RQG91329.1 PAS domain S-box protein [Natrarchaeobius halalkaliphilus]